MKKWITVSFLLAIWLIWVTPASAQEIEPVVYTSPEGIRFVSHSSLWDESALRGLYETLLRCEHGEELTELKEVILSPETSAGESGFRVGNYNETTKTIRLFEVENGPVERTLIHEYGHHFTYYWLHEKEGFYPDRLTELSAWSKLRQLDGFPIRWFGSPLPYLHKWDPNEIMAEDYVLLFGVGGMKMPQQPQEAVNLLRHENEYIPAAQSIPELRRYWEKLAGLKSKAPIRIPMIQDWQAVGDKPEETDAYKFVFSSSATWDRQLIRYGIQATAIGPEGGEPIQWMTGLDARGEDPVKANLDLTPALQSFRSFKLYVQIWALDPDSQQLASTPVYANWFSYDDTTGSLKAIPPDFEATGTAATLKSEGMDTWPLIQLFIDGKPKTLFSRYEDPKGDVYIPLRLFDERKEKAGPKVEAASIYENLQLTARFHRRDVELQMEQKHALVDNLQVPLLKNMILKGSDGLVSVSDLPQLFGVKADLDAAENSLFVETNGF